MEIQRNNRLKIVIVRYLQRRKRQMELNIYWYRQNNSKT